MGQTLGWLKDRAQGKFPFIHLLTSSASTAICKVQVRRISDKVFEQCAEKNVLLLDKLHVATLMVYNINGVHLFDLVTVQEIISSKGYLGIDKNEFFDLIIEWIHKDLRIVLANRIILAAVAAPIMAIKTKSVAMQVPKVRDVAEKVPTPVIISAYSIGLVLLQDSRVY
ncbi:hypothetical protein AXF42_Ash019738 [Apostasia shenzhenica]|uniref:Uncharacterized protein n=1 Tax=Apostasia shenzhenica TaxID=1088818 RepID=A0A2H9ZRQ9_9ASPA|nr:hypothetical protein AXF42_Ash019738 [Apostasia shenzhenica]